MSCNYNDSGEVHPISRFLINPSGEQMRAYFTSGEVNPVAVRFIALEFKQTKPEGAGCLTTICLA
uniref:Uncharacterized protein n=1 Tax=candidate division WOR-3 bacterium TaxID=2052148 RepID=A0A7C6EJJ8_UNCW3